jgi:hypothetical protein
MTFLCGTERVVFKNGLVGIYFPVFLSCSFVYTRQIYLLCDLIKSLFPSLFVITSGTILTPKFFVVLLRYILFLNKYKKPPE